MASEVLKNAHFSYAGTDLSSYVRSITLTYEAETADDTAMGDGTRSNIGGLKNWSVEVEFNQDYTSSAVDDTLFSLVGTANAIVIRPDAGSVSTTNPEFGGTGVLSSYPPLGGSVGDVHTTSVSIVPGGSSPTLTRSTT